MTEGPAHGPVNPFISLFEHAVTLPYNSQHAFALAAKKVLQRSFWHVSIGFKIETGDLLQQADLDTEIDRNDFSFSRMREIKNWIEFPFKNNYNIFRLFKSRLVIPHMSFRTFRQLEFVNFQEDTLYEADEQARQLIHWLQ